MASTKIRKETTRKVPELVEFSSTKDLRDKLLNIPAKMRSEEMSFNEANSAINAYKEVRKVLELESKERYERRRFGPDVSVRAIDM